MAANLITRTPPFGAVATFRTVQFVSNITNMLINWNETRVTRNALSRLSDRELDDIGLCRADIGNL